MWEGFSFQVLTRVVCGTLSSDGGSVLSCYAILAGPRGLWKFLQRGFVSPLMRHSSPHATLLAYLEKGNHEGAKQLECSLNMTSIVTIFLKRRMCGGGCQELLTLFGGHVARLLGSTLSTESRGNNCPLTSSRSCRF